jgi:hypothetical protein
MGQVESWSSQDREVFALRNLFAAITRNSLSLLGSAITTIAAVLILTLFGLSLVGLTGSPYLGILIYLVLPAIFVLGLRPAPCRGTVASLRRREPCNRQSFSASAPRVPPTVHYFGSPALTPAFRKCKKDNANLGSRWATLPRIQVSHSEVRFRWRHAVAGRGEGGLATCGSGDPTRAAGISKRGWNMRTQLRVVNEHLNCSGCW